MAPVASTVITRVPVSVYRMYGPSTDKESRQGFEAADKEKMFTANRAMNTKVFRFVRLIGCQFYRTKMAKNLRNSYCISCRRTSVSGSMPDSTETSVWLK